MTETKNTIEYYVYSVYNKELEKNGQSEGHTAFEERWVGAKENSRKSSPFCSSHKERVSHCPAPKKGLADRYLEEHRKAGKH